MILKREGGCQAQGELDEEFGAGAHSQTFAGTADAFPVIHCA